MTQHTESSESKIERGLSLLEKTVQARFALLLLSLVFAADIGLNRYFQQSLTAFQWGVKGTGVPFGAVVVFGGAFMFFMAAVAPKMLRFLESLFVDFNLTRSADFDSEGNYRVGWVSLREAKKRALEEKDSFWIQRIADEEARHQREQDEQQLMARISFGCTLLFLGDLLCAGPASLIRAGGVELGRLDSPLPIGIVLILGFMLMMFMALPWIGWLRRDRHPIRWIQHPQMAEERYRELREQDGGPLYRRHARLRA